MGGVERVGDDTQRRGQDHGTLGRARLTYGHSRQHLRARYELTDKSDQIAARGVKKEPRSSG